MTSTTTTATADDPNPPPPQPPPSPPPTVDSIPTLDLRYLSQSELYALSLTSPSYFDVKRTDDVVFPKIDRSVFNESAGSRKQTFSRYRLAPSGSGKNRPRSRSHFGHSVGTRDDPEREEDLKIIAVLKELFKANDPSYDEVFPVKVESSGVGVGEVANVNVVENGTDEAHDNVVQEEKTEELREDNVVENVDGGRKRGRGRPKRNGKVNSGGSNVRRRVVERKVAVRENVFEDKGDKEILNPKGEVVDLGVLARLEDPFAEELRRRTVGMGTAEELLTFLQGLNGQWGSRRKKRRVVDASEFGDVLPKGWKLILSIRRKEGRIWLFCRRYISPSGRQFETCKDVSAYLLSILGPQTLNSSNYANSISCNDFTFEAASGDATDRVLQGDSKINNVASTSSSPATSLSGHLETPVTLDTEDPVKVQAEETFRCSKCIMSFDRSDDLLQHELVSHSRKRSQPSTTVNEGVMIKSGKYECQFCHETFNERNRYDGHIVSHLRSEVNDTERSATVSVEENVNPALVGVDPETESLVLATNVADVNVVEDFHANSNDQSYSAAAHSKVTVFSKAENAIDKLVHDNREIQGKDVGKVNGKKSCDAPSRNLNASNDEVCVIDNGTDVISATTDIRGDCERVKEIENNVTECIDNEVKECGIEHNRSLDSSLLSPAGRKACTVVNDVVEGPASLDVLDEVSESGFITLNSEGKVGDVGTVDDVSIADKCTSEWKKVVNRKSSSGFCSSLSLLDRFDGHSLNPPPAEFLDADIETNGPTQLTRADPEKKRVSSSLVSSELEEHIDLERHYCDSQAEWDINDGSTSKAKKHHESYSAVSSGREEVFVKEPRVQHGPESNLLLSNCGKNWDSDSHEDKFSGRRAEEKKLNEFHSYRNSEPIFPSGTGESALNPSDVDVSKQSNFEFCSLVPSRNEQSFGLQDDVTGLYDGSIEDCEQESSKRELLNQFCFGDTSDDLFSDKMYSATLDDLKFDANRDIDRHEQEKDLFAFGNHVELYADATHAEQEKDFFNCSVGPSENERNFDVQTNLSMFSSSMPVEHNVGTGPMGSLFRLSSNSEIGGFGNAFSTYHGRHLEGPKVAEIGNSVNRNFNIGSGSRGGRHGEDVSPGGTWRTGERNTSGRALADSTQLQSPSCYGAFDVMSQKEEDNFFRLGNQFNGGLGVGNFRPGRSEPVEISFMPTQNSNSLEGNSKVFSYGAEINQAFDSSMWLHRDALMPNVAVRNHVRALCVWCGNEFYDQNVHSGNGIGPMCQTCSARISSPGNMF